ncbi:MAG: hypothetical protein AB1497_01465 [Bacillota bacterium]
MNRAKAFRITVTLLTVTLLISGLLSGCGTGNPPRTEPPSKNDPASTRPRFGAQGPKLPFRHEDGKTILGPFSSWVRGIDWFWCRDGQTILLTVEKDGSLQLWLIDAGSGDSLLLREAEGLDAMFPVAWYGSGAVVTLDLPRVPQHLTRVTVTDFSGEKVFSRTAGEYEGWSKSHAATSDGRLLSVHLDTPQGGKIWQVDISAGTSTDLLQGLPSWDGLYPVWFSPDGRHAVMPEPDSAGQMRLRLLDLVNGDVKALEPVLDSVDIVRWSASGNAFAYKVADGSHRTDINGESWSILSPRIRVISASGEIVEELVLPDGQLADNLAWLDEKSLVISTRTAAEEYGPTWTVTLGSGFKKATPEQSRVFEERIFPYPMDKGTSSRYSVEIRFWQDPGKAPTEELIITPLK